MSHEPQNPTRPCRTPISVADRMAALRAGDEATVTWLLDAYRGRLVKYIQNAMLERRMSRGSASASDFVQEGLRSFVSWVRKGPDLDLVDEGALWKLLTTFTIRKMLASDRKNKKAHASGGGVITIADLGRVDEDRLVALLESLESNEAAPGDALDEMEELTTLSRMRAKLLDALGSYTTRTIIELLLDGHSVGEVMDRTGSARATIYRKVALAKLIWERLAKDELAQGLR